MKGSAMPVIKQDERSLYLKRSGNIRPYRPVIETRFKKGDNVVTNRMINCSVELIRVGGDENPEYWAVDISNRDWEQVKAKAIAEHHNLFYPQWATV